MIGIRDSIPPPRDFDPNEYISYAFNESNILRISPNLNATKTDWWKAAMVSVDKPLIVWWHLTLSGANKYETYNEKYVTVLWHMYGIYYLIFLCMYI